MSVSAERLQAALVAQGVPPDVIRMWSPEWALPDEVYVQRLGRRVRDFLFQSGVTYQNGWA